VKIFLAALVAVPFAVEQASSALDAAGVDGWDNAKAACKQAPWDLKATWAGVGASEN
jgi:type II secretory pathway component PulK